MVLPPTNRETSVFLDSTVLIAAAISAHGHARELVVGGLAGNRGLRLYLSTLVLRETERNLAKKQPKALPIFALFAETLSTAIVDPPKSLVLEVAKVVAVKDAPIVAGAISAQTGYLATYDRRHLLQLKAQIDTAFGVIVATPEEVLVGTA